MDRVVQLAVAAAVEPVADVRAAGRLDGGDAGVAGEVGSVLEPGGVTHDAEDLRGEDRADAGDFGEGGAGGVDRLP